MAITQVLSDNQTLPLPFPQSTAISRFDLLFISQVAPPPVLSQTSGSSYSSETDYVQITLVTAAGESLPSNEVSFAKSASNVLNVASPPAYLANQGVTGYNVYAATSSGAEKKQTSTAIALGTAWVEATTGGITTSGSTPPTASTAAGMATVQQFSLWPSSGTLATDQAALAPVFIGCSADVRLSTETTIGIRTIITDGIFDVDVINSYSPSLGDLLGPSYGNSGSVLQNQMLQQVTSKSKAVGIVVGIPTQTGNAQSWGANSTRVRARLTGALSYQWANHP